MTQNLEGMTVAILVADGFEEIELKSPKEALEQQGAMVDIISPNKDLVKAKEGNDWSRDYQVDKPLDDAYAGDYHALLLPGGVINPDKLRTNEQALAFVSDFFAHGKPVAAICHGPQVLIDAEVVSGKRMTSVAAIRKDLENAGAQWEDAEVVEDSGLVTSRTPEDLPAFNQKMVEVFSQVALNQG